MKLPGFSGSRSAKGRCAMPRRLKRKLSVDGNKCRPIEDRALYYPSPPRGLAESPRRRAPASRNPGPDPIGHASRPRRRSLSHPRPRFAVPWTLPHLSPRHDRASGVYPTPAGPPQATLALPLSSVHLLSGHRRGVAPLGVQPCGFPSRRPGRLPLRRPTSRERISSSGLPLPVQGPAGPPCAERAASEPTHQSATLLLGHPS
jgi:hypothetical protein